MRAPLPYGLFVTGGQATANDLAQADALAREVTNMRLTGGLVAHRMSSPLHDGGVVVADFSGGSFRVHIDKTQESAASDDESVTLDVPMLFSGSIVKAWCKPGEGVTVSLTEQARKRIAGYSSDTPLAPATVELHRFRIEYGDDFRHFLPDEPGELTFTQYVKHRPTWYSGAMAAVVQVVAGYGIQAKALLPERVIERAVMKLPTQVLNKVRAELAGVLLPAYTGTVPQDGKIRYEYRPSGCSGVGFDGGGGAWLLRLGARGVFAMPLPLVPATTTGAFRSYVESVNDQELLEILDRFGGMPSGETFPAGEAEFEAWRRAGVIVKVCEASDFYDFSPMYAACGWAFNDNATEAFNTCWHRDDSHLLRVHAYKMRLALKPAKNGGRIKPDESNVAADPIHQQMLGEYLGRIYGAIGSDSRGRAMRYKIMRTPARDLLARVNQSTSSEVAYWEALEMPPIGSHSGNVARVGSGPVYRPGLVPWAEGRLKFPESRGRGCESFVMVSPDYTGPTVRCDTVMFGCYVNNRLEVIKYFWDDRQFLRETQSTLEEVMIVGQWEETVSDVPTGLAGNFYTSSFDDRQEQEPYTKYTSITGTDMGYGEPAWKTPDLLYRTGALSRARYYKHKTITKNYGGFSLDVGVCVPNYTRDAVLYAYRDYTHGGTEEMRTSLHSMVDPTAYQLWTHDDLFHFMGGTNMGNLGEPRPSEGAPVYLDSLIHTPTEYSDFAESGNWYNLPPGSFLDVSGIVAPYTSRANKNKSVGGVIIGGRGPSFSEEYTKSETDGFETGRVSIAAEGEPDESLVRHIIPHGYYFEFSPVVPNYYFYRDTTRISIGSKGYSSVDELNSNGVRRFWGKTKQSDDMAATYFIGVINE